MWVVCDVFDMILLALSTIDNSMRIVMRLGLGDVSLMVLVGSACWKFRCPFRLSPYLYTHVVNLCAAELRTFDLK